MFGANLESSIGSASLDDTYTSTTRSELPLVQVNFHIIYAFKLFLTDYIQRSVYLKIFVSVKNRQARRQRHREHLRNLSSRLQQALSDSERETEDREAEFDAARKERERLRAAAHEKLARAQLGGVAPPDGQETLGVGGTRPRIAPKPKPKPKPHARNQERAAGGNEAQDAEDANDGQASREKEKRVDRSPIDSAEAGNPDADADDFYRPRVLTWDGTLPRSAREELTSNDAAAVVRSGSGDETETAHRTRPRDREARPHAAGEYEPDADADRLPHEDAPDVHTKGTRGGGRSRGGHLSVPAGGPRAATSPLHIITEDSNANASRPDQKRAEKQRAGERTELRPGASGLLQVSPAAARSSKPRMHEHSDGDGPSGDGDGGEGDGDPSLEPSGKGGRSSHPSQRRMAARGEPDEDYIRDQADAAAGVSEGDRQRVRSDRDREREGLVPSGLVRARIHEHEHHTPARPAGRDAAGARDGNEGGARDGDGDGDRRESEGFENVNMKELKAAFEPKRQHSSRAPGLHSPEATKNAPKSPPAGTSSSAGKSKKRPDKKPQADGERSELARTPFDSVVGGRQPEDDNEEFPESARPRRRSDVGAGYANEAADGDELEFEQMASTNLALSGDFDEPGAEDGTGNFTAPGVGATGAPRKSSESRRRPKKTVSRRSLRSSPARDALESSEQREAEAADEEPTQRFLAAAEPDLKQELHRLPDSPEKHSQTQKLSASAQVCAELMFIL